LQLGQAYPESVAMNQSMLNVLSIFQRYRVKPGQMLFIHNLESGPASAMAKLINDGLVVRDNPRNSYCLTPAGFQAVQGL
jgi:hypothetical protein